MIVNFVVIKHSNMRTKTISALILMLIFMMTLSCGNKGNDNKNGINSEVMTLLQTIYPNSMDADMAWSSLATERFAEYASEECDYDPVYQTQDAYSYGILPDPKFSKVPSVDNAYKVEWQLKYGEDITRNSVVLVLSKENGEWKIDNIWDEESKALLFDYSKPPVPDYEY